MAKAGTKDDNGRNKGEAAMKIGRREFLAALLFKI